MICRHMGRDDARRGGATTSRTRGARAEERQHNNQPNKRLESGRTRGDGAAKGGGAGRGGDSIRRGNATASQTRGVRAEERETTTRQEEKAATPSDPPLDWMWRVEEN